MAFKRYLPAVVAVILWVGLFGGLVLVAAWTHLDYHIAKSIGYRQNASSDYRYLVAFLISYLAISIPAALASLAAFEMLGRGRARFTMRTIFIAVTAIAISLGLAVAEDSMNHPERAALFAAYLVAISVTLWWLLHRVRPSA
jgi:hypothetical protein